MKLLIEEYMCRMNEMPTLKGDYVRYAILSDVHGNVHALKAVLDDALKENIEGYFGLGDYYGDFPYPNEVTDMIKGLDRKEVVSGNKEGYLLALHESDQKDWVHDQFKGLYWNYKELRKENLDYLLQLPEQKTMKVNNTKKILLIHSITSLFKETNLDLLTSSRFAEAMDKEPFEYESYLQYIEELLLADERFLEKLAAIDADIIVFGHTHLQWHAKVKSKILINAGSCGLPLDYRTTAPYTIIDVENDRITIEERRVEYDRHKLVEEVKKSVLYRHAKDWCDIVLSELLIARDEVAFFFRHILEVAKKCNKDSWPLDNDIWAMGVKSWFEGKSLKYIGGIKMPFVNLKLVKSQVSPEKKKELIEGLTDLVVNIMGRERSFTVITVDEYDEDQWAIGGKALSEIHKEKQIVSFVNIKVSKGTTNPDEMSNMIIAIKDLFVRVLGNSDKTNYVIIDELNPDGWGFDGLSMTQRRKLEA